MWPGPALPCARALQLGRRSPWCVGDPEPAREAAYAALDVVGQSQAKRHVAVRTRECLKDAKIVVTETRRVCAAAAAAAVDCAEECEAKFKALHELAPLSAGNAGWIGEADPNQVWKRCYQKSADASP